VPSNEWPDHCTCPHCNSTDVIKRGKDEIEPARQRYCCKTCTKQFDDLTGTIFSGHHQPLKVWVLCLYFMGLNLSNLQISKELDLNKDDVHAMTSQLREGVFERAPDVTLSGEVEFDEVYVVAGHKGNPAAVKKKGVRVEEIVSRVLGDAER
jgi:transposase-like protein